MISTQKTARWQLIKCNLDGVSYVKYSGKRYKLKKFYFDKNDCAVLPMSNSCVLCLKVSPSGMKAKLWG